MKFFAQSKLYTRSQYIRAVDIYIDTHDVPTAAAETGISVRQVYRFLHLNGIHFTPAYAVAWRARWKRAADLRTIYTATRIAAIMGVSTRSVLRYLARYRKTNPTHPAFQ